MRDKLHEFFAMNWQTTRIAVASQEFHLGGVKGNNKHFRARKEILCKWAVKEFPDISPEVIAREIDDTFLCPAGWLYDYPTIPEAFLEIPGFDPTTGTVNR